MNDNLFIIKPLEEFIGTETCSYCDTLTECLSLPVDEDTERFTCRDCIVQAFAVALGESVERSRIAAEVERMYGPHDRRFKTAIEIADKLRSPQPPFTGGMMSGCADCNHIEHEPGQCKQCNCGESGLVHLTAFRKITICRPDSFSTTSSITFYGYDKGHRVPRRRTDNQ